MCFYVKRLTASGCKQTQVIPGWLDEWKYVHWMVLKWAAECQWGPILEFVVLNVKTEIIQKTPAIPRPFWRLLAFTFLKWSFFVGEVFNFYIFSSFFQPTGVSRCVNFIIFSRVSVSSLCENMRSSNWNY